MKPEVFSPPAHSKKPEGVAGIVETSETPLGVERVTSWRAELRPEGETPQQLAQARRQFAMDEIKAWLNAKVAENRARIIEEAKAKPDLSDLP